jgi:hypothetical protein
VSKKQSKPKAKSRAQRLRQQKGMERAEAVLDQKEIKLAKSNNRAKVVKNRRVRLIFSRVLIRKLIYVV